jgi:hypothetical protein
LSPVVGWTQSSIFPVVVRVWWIKAQIASIMPPTAARVTLDLICYRNTCKMASAREGFCAGDLHPKDQRILALPHSIRSPRHWRLIDGDIPDTEPGKYKRRLPSYLGASAINRHYLERQESNPSLEVAFRPDIGPLSLLFKRGFKIPRRHRCQDGQQAGPNADSNADLFANGDFIAAGR